MQQLILREIIRIFGEARKKAALAEMKQIHMWYIFKPVLLGDLSPEKKG